MLRIDESQANHYGGKLAFRPGEPYLCISLGDGANIATGVALVEAYDISL